MTDPAKDAERLDLAERFWSCVHKGGPDECWPWHGVRGQADPDNYGSVRVDGKNYRSHRLAWMLENGAIPEGMLVCHRCDNPPCVNPAHLFLGTVTDNNRDCCAKGRRGTVPPRNWCPGSAHGESKLKEADVLEIRALAGKVPQRKIAARYGLTQGVIWRIIHRKAWRHV